MENIIRLLPGLYKSLSLLCLIFIASFGQLSSFGGYGIGPTISAPKGDRTVADTDFKPGESVPFTATGEDSDGQVEELEWLLDGSVVGKGNELTITLPDGRSVVSVRATDNHGNVATLDFTMTVVSPHPLSLFLKNELYEGLGGDEWLKKDGWGKADTPVCNWYGIICDTDGSGIVRGIELPDNNLSGAIPMSLWDLDDLTSLDLSGSAIIGELPVEISLKRIEEIDLRFNQLSGPLPVAFLKHRKLNSLKLSGNKLNGSLPLIGTLNQSLTWLELTGNSFSGNIARMWMSFTNLEALLLGDNNFDGNLPEMLNDMNKLKYLGIYNNNLTGPIPNIFGSLKNLEYLYLYRNKLSGPIPNLDGLTKLKSLDLSNNEFKGDLADRFSSLADLQRLTLIGNEWAGPPPAWIQTLLDRGVTVSTESDCEVTTKGMVKCTSFAFTKTPSTIELMLYSASVDRTEIQAHFRDTNTDERKQFTVDFSASDSDGQVVSYEFVVNGETTKIDASPDSRGHNFTQQVLRGENSITATAIDNHGGRVSETKKFWVTPKGALSITFNKLDKLTSGGFAVIADTDGKPGEFVEIDIKGAGTNCPAVATGRSSLPCIYPYEITLMSRDHKVDEHDQTTTRLFNSEKGILEDGYIFDNGPGEIYVRAVEENTGQIIEATLNYSVLPPAYIPDAIWPDAVSGQRINLFSNITELKGFYLALTETPGLLRRNDGADFDGRYINNIAKITGTEMSSCFKMFDVTSNTEPVDQEYAVRFTVGTKTNGAGQDITVLTLADFRLFNPTGMIFVNNGGSGPESPYCSGRLRMDGNTIVSYTDYVYLGDSNVTRFKLVPLPGGGSLELGVGKITVGSYKDGYAAWEN